MPTTNAEDAAARLESEETDLGLEDDRTEQLIFVCDDGAEAETRHHEDGGGDDDDDDDFKDKDKDEDDDDDDSLGTLGLMESQLFSLRERYEESERKSISENDDFRQRLRRSEREKSILQSLLEKNKTTVLDEFCQEFFLGVIGLAPPLFAYRDRVRKYLRCRGSAPPSEARHVINVFQIITAMERIRSGLRIFFLVFLSLVDFADAILDTAVSVMDILNPDTFLHGWALWLLIMSFIARVLGGMFAASYTHIEDESDRETSYFLIEMTIVCLQDMASYVYITVKRYRIGDIELIDQMSMYMTILCSIMISVPTLWRYKIIAKQLPPHTSWIIFLNLFFCFYPIIRLFMKDTDFVEQHLETVCRSIYGVLLSLQLFVLYRWGRYMYHKTLKREPEVNGSKELTNEASKEHGFRDLTISATTKDNIDW